jgi:hypothetical protein
MISLLDDIAAFVTAHGLSERRLGELALNDSKFVRDVRNGRSPSLNTVAKLKSFMLTYQGQEAA